MMPINFMTLIWSKKEESLKNFRMKSKLKKVSKDIRLNLMHAEID
jgi:hypothetical protein